MDNQTVIDATLNGYALGDIVIEGAADSGDGVIAVEDTEGFELYGVVLRKGRARGLRLSDCVNFTIGAPGKPNSIYNNGVAFQNGENVYVINGAVGVIQNNRIGITEAGAAGDDNPNRGLNSLNTSEFSNCLEVVVCPDADGDNLCDAMDPCPFDPDNDLDNDGFCGDVDNCPADANPDQYDLDMDGIGDACDPEVFIDEVTTDLSNYIEDIGLNPRVERALTGRLDQVLIRLCSFGSPASAIGYLNNMISYVQYQSGNAIPAEEADYILDQLQAMIAAINAGTTLCATGNLPGMPGAPAGNTASVLQLVVFPNPAADELNIQVAGLEGEGQLAIYDQLGRQVWTAVVEAGQSTLQLTLEESRYANGLYFVRLAAAEETKTKRVIVNR